MTYSYRYLVLQLFVRISIHWSSPGEKSSPQECGEGLFDEEMDGSRFALKYTHGSQKGPFCPLSGGNAFVGSKLAANYSPAFFFV
jgi:hypothetical protein